MKLAFRSTSADATFELGRRLGAWAPPGTVLTLDGDLGTGKTTLVRGLGLGLGIEEGISSPTYMLMLAHEGGRLPLYHFDAWMEGREKALLADGADEYLGGEGIAVIEWGSRVQAWLPEPRLALTLGHLTPAERTIELELVGAGPALGTDVGQGLTELLERFEGPEPVPGLLAAGQGRATEDSAVNP